MATRTKTVEYAFPLSTAAVATAVARDFTQLAALVLPETTGRTFRSVMLEVSVVDNSVAAASCTAMLIGIALGAVGRDDATVTQTITNSGEQTHLVFIRDVTSYFTTNYTGTTMTADCRITVTGIATVNATAKLIITYDYDDAATNVLKTIRIPVDGATAALTGTFANLGGVANQIPLLDEFCPEQGIVFRDIFFQIEGHSGTSAAAAQVLNMRYDGVTTIADGSNARTLVSDVRTRRIDKLLGAITTSASHSIEANTSSTTGGPFPCLCGFLVVTYSHDVTPATATLAETLTDVDTGVDISSATGMVAPFTIQIGSEHMRVTSIAGSTLTVTRGVNGTTAAAHTSGDPVLPVILNSIMLPFGSDGTWTAGTATGDKMRNEVRFSIEEPGTPVLAQSGVFYTLVDNAGVTVDLRIGAQASRTFTHATAVRGGSMPQMRRLDAGASGGAGFTPARGYNSIDVDHFTTGSTAGTLGSAWSGLVSVNYYSGQHALGEGAHNHTVLWCTQPNSTGNNVMRRQSNDNLTPIIAETEFWLQSVGYEVLCTVYGTAAAVMGVAVACEVQAGEAEAAGWRGLGAWLMSTDSEAGWHQLFIDATDHFLQWPGDPMTARKLNIQTDRDYRYDFGTTAGASHWQTVAMLTYHGITFAVAGTISDSGGSTVNIDAYRTDTGELVGSTSRTGDGAYSISVYDDTVPVAVRAYESSTKFGASKEAVAGTGGFNISLHTTGPGGGGGGQGHSATLQFGGQVP